MISSSLAIERRRVCELTPYTRNARTHSKKQVRQIADSIERFGFTNPVLVGDEGEIIAGHGRVAAAKLLAMETVPCVRLSHLSLAERRAYVLADNKLALNAGWDQELLAAEFEALSALDFDLAITGFSLAEIDIVLDAAADADPTAKEGREDAAVALAPAAVSRRGDLWALGRHKLLCGDARDADDYQRLLGEERVSMVFTDPPYNVAVDGNVCGSGGVRHREFAMASGEMSGAEFTAFLTHSLTAMADRCSDGAIAFVCMDWRHMGELLEAGGRAFTELKNLIVWNKNNAGMGSFYRSKHELVFVFKKGAAPHINNFGLGEGGHHRTNVWDYAGISSFGSARDQELAMHPTVKPVALVADAIRDCSKRGDIILDGFGGSGTTLIAAEKTGRTARLVEYDPRYCDTIIRRFERVTGKQARLVDTGQDFEDVESARRELGA